MARWIVELAKNAAKDPAERHALRRQEIAFQLRAIMEEKGVSSRELSRRLELAESRVSHLLSGRANMQLDTMCSLADALDVPLTIKFGNSVKKVDPSKGAPIKATVTIGYSFQSGASNDYAYSPEKRVSGGA